MYVCKIKHFSQIERTHHLYQLTMVDQIQSLSYRRPGTVHCHQLQLVDGPLQPLVVAAVDHRTSYLVLGPADRHHLEAYRRAGRPLAGLGDSADDGAGPYERVDIAGMVDGNTDAEGIAGTADGRVVVAEADNRSQGVVAEEVVVPTGDLDQRLRVDTADTEPVTEVTSVQSVAAGGPAVAEHQDDWAASAADVAACRVSRVAADDLEVVDLAAAVVAARGHVHGVTCAGVHL